MNKSAEISLPPDGQDLAQELHHTLVYSSDPVFRGSIKRIADILGKSPWTVRDMLKGRIQVSLRLLHAACIATDHHPLVRRLLEPLGARLVPLAPVDPARPAEDALVDVALPWGRLIALARQVKGAAKRGRRRPDRQAALGLLKEMDALEQAWQQARASLTALAQGQEQHPPALQAVGQ